MMLPIPSRGWRSGGSAALVMLALPTSLCVLAATGAAAPDPTPLTIAPAAELPPPLPRAEGELQPLDLTRATPAAEGLEIALSGGRRARLTLDPALTALLERVLAQADAPLGAIVVMDLDGRVRAAAGRRAGAAAPELISTAWAPSASVFKLVTAAALLEAGIDPAGEICWHGGVRRLEAEDLDDGPLDTSCGGLGFGLAHSQNVILGKLADRTLDPARLARVAERWGWNARPAGALPATASLCTLPSTRLEFARAAAGFWHTTLSPLQGAVAVNVIASGGHRVTPQIVEGVIDDAGELHRFLPPASERVLDETSARTMSSMLADTTEHGTARRGFRDDGGRALLPFRVAGKTGSLTGPPSGRGEPPIAYSWFVGFAPADEPRIVISVLLGNGPAYRLKAHTAARLVLAEALR